MIADAQRALHPLRCYGVDDCFNGLGHNRIDGKLFPKAQGKSKRLAGKNIPCEKTAMEKKRFKEIADRLKWHRTQVEQVTQSEYAARIGVERSVLKNWETGNYRLSLDGALSLRRTYGLSLDFMYEGIDDALPMTLRQAWRSKPAVMASK